MAFEIHQLDDRLRFVACNWLVEGTSAFILRTVTVLNYEELKNILICGFGRSLTTEVRHRRLKPDEGCILDAIEMQDIAMNHLALASNLVLLNMCLATLIQNGVSINAAASDIH